MNDTIEDDVRSAFARLTDPVVPDPDPLGRLLARRRERTWRRGLGAVSAAVVLAVGGGTLATVPVGGPTPSPDDRDSTVSRRFDVRGRMDEWTRRLLAAPTRGNLAGDTAYIEAITRAAGNRNQMFVDPAQDQTKVLALADVGDARIAVTARYNDEFGTIQVHSALPGATADQLVDGAGITGPLLPFFAEPVPVLGRTTGIVLTPAGCTLDSSAATTIAADGTAHRTWASRGDHVIAPGDPSGTWWRVTCDGTVRFEGRNDFSEPMVDIRPEPFVPARGYAAPALVGTAIEGWRTATAHLGGAAPQVLWAGLDGEGRETVVVAGPGRDGRVLVTALTGPGGDYAGPGLDHDVRLAAPYPGVHYNGRQPYRGESTGREGGALVVPMAFGTATAASTDLVVVRLPAAENLSTASGRLLVVAPPSATRLLVQGAGPGIGSVALTDGVGTIAAPAPLTAHTLTAVDAGGNVVATARYGEPDAAGQLFGERVVDDWG